MLWLAAYYPDWAFQHLKYRHELQLTKGCLLFAPKSLQVLAQDRVAADAGIHIGMSVSTAQSLLPNVVLIEFEQDMVEQACQWLCQWSYSFSARVVPLQCAHTRVESSLLGRGKFAVNEFVSNCLVMEVSSMALVFDGVENLAEQYARRAISLGLELQLAIAETPLAAQLLAQQAPTYVTTDIEETADVPDGTRSYHPSRDSVSAEVLQRQQRYLQHDDNALLLDTLPLQGLPVSAYLRQAFNDMGLHTFSALTALPQKELGQRYGKPLLQMMAKITGQLPQPLRYFEPANEYQQKLTLLYEVESMQGIVFPLKRMIDDMAGYLLQRQWALPVLRLILHYRDQELPPLEITIHYPFAEHRSEALLSLCRMQLTRMTLYQPVVEIELRADKFVPAVQGQAALLDQQAKKGRKAGACQYLLSTLQARLGANKVKGLQSISAHFPEHCWQSLGLEHIGKSQVAVKAKSTLAAGACRPLWLLATPTAIAMNDIALIKGPERLQAHWWQQDEQCRDYYIASHIDGGLCWVYQVADGFFLHGWFS
ncbi:DNA repair nucleotidyltransferase [Shewanella sairae]|uniref:DNA repair nucleotidyltransferase n=1 Tax=Shewanella sairae TaxID=190310 RepID=A0ABQ4PBD2_9GAMM|nr:DNA polymerase Y family protein [Shewanella sairae]MCL1130189.1 DNA polymerase Y family protein [Shewanella sairae]GIU44699.1 DNA repair nucleotidyltransferase [Shewanella sairae]